MGAHLPFHEELPTWAMDAGADVCVVSVHKMGRDSNKARCFTYKVIVSIPRACRHAPIC